MKRTFSVSKLLRKLILLLIVYLIFQNPLKAQHSQIKEYEVVSTFSIVARDSITGELGVAVASRFFAVGSVVPWAEANVGVVATQAFANTSFGWRALDLLDLGLKPDEVINVLLRGDKSPTKRQVGIVDAFGNSATYTGQNCTFWAGGRNGPNYAIQGNILQGEKVVVGMEDAFLQTKGTLADRIYASLLAGEKNGGDSRGKQSAAIIIVKEGAGYGGYTDLAIDIRVDDHKVPFKELGRLLNLAQMNSAWNEGWTLFMQQKYEEALPHLEKAIQLVPSHPELLYDLAVVRLAASKKEESLDALKKAIEVNPKLKSQAAADKDLETLKEDAEFKKLISLD